ncbi:hypothetical protein D3C87_935040 [compost metagenome]
MMDFVYEVVTRREFDDGFVSDQFVRWDGVSSSFEEIKQNILYVEKHKVVALRQDKWGQTTFRKRSENVVCPLFFHFFPVFSEK